MSASLGVVTDEADFLSRIAMELDAELTMSSTAELIAEYAMVTTAADDAGILFVRSRKHLETLTASSDRVRELHQLQRDYDEGPCLDAIRHEMAYVTGGVATDERWPRWGARATALGVQSVLSFRLETKTRSYGALNLYAETPDAFGPHDVTIAHNFARHATIALSSAYTQEGLHIAIDARTFVGQAQGMLMARYGISAEQAFEFLRRRSQQENVKLSDIAQDVIEHRDTPVDPGE